MLKYQCFFFFFSVWGRSYSFFAHIKFWLNQKNDLVFKLHESICQRNEPQKFGFHDAETIRTYFSLCQVPAFHAGVDVPYQCLLTVQLLTDKCGVLVIKITTLFTFPFFLSQWIKHSCYNLLSKAFFYFSWVLFKCIVHFLILTTSIL